MPYIGKQLVRGQNRKLDDISSGFNGSQTTFTLQVASQNVTVGSALQLWISLGGVIQEPTIDYTIAGNQITFTTAPAASLDFFGVIQGDVTDTNTPGDATVTTSKLATGLTVNLTDGSAATSSLQLGGTDSGLFSSAADKVNVTTGGVERLEIGDSEVVFNDPSNDVDFRVESNGNTHMLFVDAGNDRVGIGTTSPSNVLHVNQTDATANSYVHITHADSGSAGTDGLSIGIEDGGVNAVIRNRENGYLRMFTNNTERMRIDSSGNVGIGTSSPGFPLHVKNPSSSACRFVLENTGSGSSDSTQIFSQNNDLAFVANDSERMRIDSSGRLLVGTSSVIGDNTEDSFFAKFQVRGTSASVNSRGQIALCTGAGSSTLTNGEGIGRIVFADGDGGGYAFIDCMADGTAGSNDYPGRLVFSTTADGASSPTERMRITRAGALRVSSQTGDSHYYADSDSFHCMHNDAINSVVAIFEHSNNSSPFGILIHFHDVSPDNNTNYFIRCADSTQSQRMVVFSDGDIDNHDNSYSGLSDLKLKQDVVDAASQWDDIKNLRVRKFKFKSDVAAYGDEAKTLIGVVAQEAELVSPGLVKENPDLDEDGNDLGTVTKSVRYSVLYMKAIKALQEAQTRIETLESQHADLLARVAALEAG